MSNIWVSVIPTCIRTAEDALYTGRTSLKLERILLSEDIAD